MGCAPAGRQSYQALGQVQPIDIFTQKAWRNLRFPLAWAPPEANVARIVADDPNLSTDQWFGVHPAAGAGAARPHSSSSARRPRC